MRVKAEAAEFPTVFPSAPSYECNTLGHQGLLAGLPPTCSLLSPCLALPRQETVLAWRLRQPRRHHVGRGLVF